MYHRLPLVSLAAGLVLLGCNTPATPPGGATGPAAAPDAATAPGTAGRQSPAPARSSRNPWVEAIEAARAQRAGTTGGATATAADDPGGYEMAGEPGAPGAEDDDPTPVATRRPTPRPTAAPATSTGTSTPPPTPKPTATPAPTSGGTLTPPPLPTPTPVPAGGSAEGAGVVLAEPDNISFNFHAKEVAPYGDFDVYGSLNGGSVRFMGTITSCSVTAGQVTMSGTGEFNGAAASFSAQGIDGAPDQLSIAISSGGVNYAIAGNLSRGSIAVAP